MVPARAMPLIPLSSFLPEERLHPPLVYHLFLVYQAKLASTVHSRVLIPPFHHLVLSPVPILLLLRMAITRYASHKDSNMDHP